MSTYIVEVDSTYRDINKYQNQTDFAVSFETNTSTDYFVQGLPYNPTGASSIFYQPCSIDRDALNSNLVVMNGNLQCIKRRDNEFYLSGIGYDQTSINTSSTGFLIKYNNVVLCAPTGIKNSSPFLCKTTRQSNGTFTFDWILFAIGSLNTNAPLYNTNISNSVVYPTSLHSIVSVSEKGGLFWFWDFNYQTFQVVKVESISGGFNRNTIYDISVSSPSILELFNNVIFAFDILGDPYFINNRPWGYHILEGDFKLLGYNQVGELTINIDRAENIYVTTNMDTTDPYYSCYSIGSPVLGRGLVTYFYETGTTGSFTGTSPGAGQYKEYFICNGAPAEFQYGDPFVTIAVSNPTGLYDFERRANIPITPFILPGYSTWGNDIVRVGNRVFNIVVPSTYLGEDYYIPGSVFPLTILEINVFTASVTSLATSASLFNACYIITATVNTDIYISVRSNAAIVYLYQFNTLTNTLTLLNSITLTTPITYYAQCSCYALNSDMLVVISPDNDNKMTDGSQLSRCRILWIMTYTISTNTFTIVNSSIQIYPTIYTQQYLAYKNNRLLYCLGYRMPTQIDIIDITSPTDPFLASSIFIKQLYGSFTPFVYQTPQLETHYLIDVFSGENAGAMYNIDDLDNIVAITIDISTQKFYGAEQEQIAGKISYGYLSSSCITPYGYRYGTSVGSSIGTKVCKFRYNLFPDTKLRSKHYFYNMSSTTSIVSSLYTSVSTILKIDTSNYVLVGSATSLFVYTIAKLFTPILQTTLTLPVALTLTPTLFQTYVYNNLIYVLISDTFNTLVCYTTSSFGSLTLIANIPRSGVLPIVGSLFYNSEFSSTPGLFLLVTEQTGLIRKYKIINTSILFVISQTIGLDGSATRPIQSTVVTYYSNTNQYVLVLSGSSVNAFGLSSYLANINVTEQTTLSLLTRTNIDNIQTFSTSFWDAILQTCGKQVTYKNMFSYNGIPYNEFASSLFNYSSPSAINNTATTKIFEGSNFNSNYKTLSNLQSNQSVIWYDKLTSTYYSAINTNGNTGTNDTITIININNIAKIQFEEGTLTINVPGNILSLTQYQSTLRTILVALVKPVSTGAGGSFTGPNKLWFYDVSNIQNAVNYPILTETTTTYSNIQGPCGIGLIHKISAFGVSEWLNVIGGPIVESSSSTQISVISSCYDNLSTLYLTGNWSRQVQFYSSYQTGPSTSVGLYPWNQFIQDKSNVQSFIGSIRITDGNWLWGQTLIGDAGNTFIQTIQKSTYTSNLFFCFYFSSINLSLYEPQISIRSPTGSYPFVDNGGPIAFFYNSASTNSAIVSITSLGVFNWRVILYSNDSTSYTNLLDLSLDETTSDSRILVCGLTNTLELVGSSNINSRIQILYPQINSETQYAHLLYQFDLSGNYIASSYQTMPARSIVNNAMVTSYSDLNLILTVNSVVPPVQGGNAIFYNKDSSQGYTLPVSINTNTIYITSYKYITTYIDSNTNLYSLLTIYNATGSYEANLLNYTVFILGYLGDPILNKNFTIRSSSYDPVLQELTLVLGELIAVNKINRQFSIINQIANSNLNYACNISISPLSNIITYSADAVVGNQIVFSSIYANQGTIDLTKQYYFVFPQITTGALTGSSTYILPVDTITFNEVSENYTATVSDINKLRVPSPSGSLYGPYLYLAQKNYSSYYSLQWYPGARTFSQTYLVGLYDVIIPNRPVRNSRYLGQRFITDFPYLYLVIYNSDKKDTFNSSVVNSVYDNNINVPRFALFQIPTTTFNPVNGGNYYSSSSSSTPKIIFSPGYYYLHFKLTDDKGNILVFDNTPYKPTDEIFEGVVPDDLLNITIRLAFKKI